MPEKIRLILTAPPSDVQAASARGLPIGHMAYRVGPGGHLLRAGMPMGLRGGLMVVDSGDFRGGGDAGFFCQQVIRECAGRGFDGVILDFEQPQQPFLTQVVSTLGGLLARRGWPLYVTEEYAGASELTKILIPSALSGGSLARRLSEAAERFGADRVALGIQRTAEDFLLPSPDGCGTPLSREELEQRVRSRGACVFFSDDLCAHYFTYMTRQGGAHFVLFDNAASIRKKILTAARLGLYACVLAWPEVDDILDNILEQGAFIPHGGGCP